jgi:hypothetical protein
VPEYGEVVLLEGQTKSILRAFPLPLVPPQYIEVTDDAVYCGRQGDGALGHSMLCRIDRQTYGMVVRVFRPSVEGDFPDDMYRPRSWTLDRGNLELYELKVDEDGVWTKDHESRWTRLDLDTLEPQARSTQGPRSSES